jgi:hypothetical protein
MSMFTAPTWTGRPAKWLWITALIEIAVAGVFIVIGLANPLLRGGFLLTGGILLLLSMGLMLWAWRWSKRAAEASRLRATGVAGQATILGMRQTGVYLNEQPQIELNLQIQTHMHGPYQATTREYVPLMLLGTLTGGRPLPVKVDPANPMNFVIEWESAMAGGMPIGAQLGAGMPPGVVPASADSSQMSPEDRRADKERILATGIAGKATVVSATPTGGTDTEGRAVYDFVLTIEVPGRPPVRGPARAGVPPERVDRLEPGDRVPLKVDPNNPASMAIDWDRA